MESEPSNFAKSLVPRGDAPPASVTDGGVKPLVSDQIRGEVMAFAVQSAVCNLGANLFEPYVNYRVQKHFAGADADPLKVKHGNYAQNLGGEIVGDLAGAGTLMLAELLFPKELHAGSQKFRKIVDPLYDGAARRVLAKQSGEQDYEKKVEEWKTFQERNLVRSLIVATGGIAGNLATQKLLLGNPSPTGLIFSGKLLSTSLTTALGLCVRLAFPNQMNAIDKKLSKKFFVPLLNKEDGLVTPGKQEVELSRADRLRQDLNRELVETTR